MDRTVLTVDSVRLLRDPDGVGGAKVNDAVGEEEVMDEEVGADAYKDIVDKEVGVKTDEPRLDEVGIADGPAGAADEEVSTIDDGSWLGGCNSRPDGPNVIVFCPDTCNFLFFVFRGISSHTEKRPSRN